MNLTIRLADKSTLRWAQEQVIAHHYLHKPVDVRCSILAYIAMLDGERVGCLMFGRPEATRCYPWYGSVVDVASGRAHRSRWEIINLARVWLHPDIQRDGQHFIPNAADAVPRKWNNSDSWRSHETLLSRGHCDLLAPSRTPCHVGHCRCPSR